MAKIANHKILSAKDSIEELLSDSRKAPVKLVYASKKNHKEISEEADDLEDFRVQLLSDYAKTDEDGNIIRKTDEEGNPTERAEFESPQDLQDFRNKLSEIYSEEVEIDVHSVDINGVGHYEAPASWGKDLSFMFEGFETEEAELRGGEVQASVNSIESILGLNEDADPVLPLKFSAALHQTYDDLITHQADIEERRYQLLQKYALKDDEGNVKTVEGSANAAFPDEETEEQFHDDLNEVYNKDFNVKATLVEVGYTDGVEIHPRHTIILDWMLTD